MPRAVANIRREHIEAFINDQLTRLRQASAANRYRSAPAVLPLARRRGRDQGKPDGADEAAEHPGDGAAGPPRSRDRGLRKATTGTSFDDRRDRAIIELFYSSGIRRADLVGLRMDDIDRDLQVVAFSSRVISARQG